MFWTIINLILSLLLVPAGFLPSINSGIRIISRAETAPAITISADKAVVFSPQNRDFFFTKKADQPQAIASITKLMTALVFLDNNPGWNKIYQITAQDNILGGRLHLFLGDRVTIKDLFYTSLIASDNGATIALVHATGLSVKEFVLKMNQKAQRLGLSQTSFSDPIGLSQNDVSTAREIAWLARTAFAKPAIRRVISRKEYRFKTVQGREKIIESTDALLTNPSPSSLQVLEGKTGYTDQAGYSFVGRFRANDGRELISVILHSSSRNERFQESQKIVSWVLNNYQW